jgi:phosphoglycerate dehydrogenase-like enzyme
MKTSTLRVLVSREHDDEAGAELLRELKGIDVHLYDPDTTELTEDQRLASVLIPPYRSSHRPIPLLGQLPNLRLVQLLSAGVDEWSADVPSSVLLASARGAHAGPVSEWVLAAILTSYRRWPALVRHQDQGIWAHRHPDVQAETLNNKRVLVVGAGAIGTAVAERVTAFGATPTLVGRTARADVRSSADLYDLLPHHQIVVIVAPLTPETDQLFTTELLGALPDQALLVNAGRGRIVDTDALVAELQTGRLWAALDVTDPEPLPGNHPLWTCRQAIISPHSARTVPGTPELCYRVAAEQIRQLRDGARPTNATDERRQP